MDRGMELKGKASSVGGRVLVCWAFMNGCCALNGFFLRGPLCAGEAFNQGLRQCLHYSSDSHLGTCFQYPVLESSTEFETRSGTPPAGQIGVLWCEGE